MSMINGLTCAAHTFLWGDVGGSFFGGVLSAVEHKGVDRWQLVSTIL